MDQRFIALETLVKAASTKGVDEQTAAYLCKLGSILICGTLERCIEILITERLTRRSPPQVAPFLRAYFRAGRNYDCEEIKQLFYKFDNGWGKAFHEYLESHQYVQESISSCYAVRNSVAHGGSQSLGPAALKQYFEASRELIGEIKKIIRK